MTANYQANLGKAAKALIKIESETIYRGITPLFKMRLNKKSTDF